MKPALRDLSQYLPSLHALRFKALPFAPLWLASAAALLALLSFYALAVAPQAQALKTLEQRAHTLALKHKPGPERVMPAPPSAVEATLRQFPDRASAPEVLAALEALAQETGVNPDKLTFDWSDDAELPLTKAEFSLPLDTEDRKVRQFLFKAKRAIPSLAIKHLRLQRKNSLAVSGSTEVRLTIYFRRFS